MQGYDYNKEGEIEKARSVGKAALICNIAVVIINFVYYSLLIIASIILVGLASSGIFYSD